MFNDFARDDARRLRQLFEEAGYTEPNLRKHLGAPELPSTRLRNHPRLMERTSAQTLLNVLLRWFWLALPQSRHEVSEVVGDEFLRLLVQSGLLSLEGDTLAAAAMVLPIYGFLVASDHPSAIERKQGEMV